MISRITTLAVVAALLVVAAAPLAAAASNFAITGVSPNNITTDRITSLSFSATINNNGCSGFAYAWNFGDGTTSTAASPSKQYSTLGTFAGEVVVSATGCNTKTKSFTITVANLAPAASLAGVSGAVAGTPFTLSASASDADGTIASYLFTIDGVAQPAQAGNTLGVTLTTAGSHTASVRATDNNGGQSTLSSISFVIAHASLAAIAVTGPATLVAGETETYALSGEDAFGNAVELAQATIDFSSITAGPAVVSYTESDVTGDLDVTILPADLASILVSGPDTLVAGTVGTYAVSGSDAFGNAVELGVDSIDVPAGQSAGSISVSYSEAGIDSNVLDVSVIAAGLASILVSGPTTLVAGETETYALSGADAYGNAVQLAQGAIDASFTQAGPDVVYYTESGVTGSLDVTVLAAALAAIDVTGAPTVVAGETETYALSGADEFGNTVGLAQATIDFSSTTAGPAVVSYTESGVTGGLDVTVVAAALAAIDVTGATTVVAGETETYALSGADAFGNPVDLAQATIDFSSITAGPAVVSYTESSVTGSLDVAIVAAALATIDVTGPATLVAGWVGTYDLAGSDAFGNEVGLAQATIDFASFVAGPATVSYEEEGVLGELGITILADELARIDVAGPATGVAGTAETFSIAGFDQYGNAAELSVGSFLHHLQTAAGTEEVCFSEGDVRGCTSIEVLADALVAISVDGPDSLAAGSSADYTLSGFDQYGNTVALAQTTVTHVAGQTVGTEIVNYTEGGITGEKIVEITPVLLGVDLTFASLSAIDTIVDGLSGQVVVNFPGDGTIAGAQVTVVLLRNLQGVGNVHNETIVGVTDADGAFDFTASPLFSLPGRYNVIVRVAALGSSGELFETINVGL